MDDGESRRHSPRCPALDPPGAGLCLLAGRGGKSAGRSVRAVAIERFGLGAVSGRGGRFVEQVVLGQRGCFQLGVGLAEAKALHALAGAPIRAGEPGDGTLLGDPPIGERRVFMDQAKQLAPALE